MKRNIDNVEKQQEEEEGKEKEKLVLLPVLPEDCWARIVMDYTDEAMYPVLMHVSKSCYRVVKFVKEHLLKYRIAAREEMSNLLQNIDYIIYLEVNSLVARIPKLRPISYFEYKSLETMFDPEVYHSTVKSCRLSFSSLDDFMKHVQKIDDAKNEDEIIPAYKLVSGQDIHEIPYQVTGSTTTTEYKEFSADEKHLFNMALFYKNFVTLVHRVIAKYNLRPNNADELNTDSHAYETAQELPTLDHLPKPFLHEETSTSKCLLYENFTNITSFGYTIEGLQNTNFEHRCFFDENLTLENKYNNSWFSRLVKEITPEPKYDNIVLSWKSLSPHIFHHTNTLQVNFQTSCPEINRMLINKARFDIAVKHRADMATLECGKTISACICSKHNHCPFFPNVTKITFFDIGRNAQQAYKKPHSYKHSRGNLPQFCASTGSINLLIWAHENKIQQPWSENLDLIAIQNHQQEFLEFFWMNSDYMPHLHKETVLDCDQEYNISNNIAGNLRKHSYQLYQKKVVQTTPDDEDKPEGEKPIAKRAYTIPAVPNYGTQIASYIHFGDNRGTYHVRETGWDFVNKSTKPMHTKMYFPFHAIESLLTEATSCGNLDFLILIYHQYHTITLPCVSRKHCSDNVDIFFKTCPNFLQIYKWLYSINKATLRYKDILAAVAHGEVEFITWVSTLQEIDFRATHIKSDPDIDYCVVNYSVKEAEHEEKYIREHVAPEPDKKNKTKKTLELHQVFNGGQHFLATCEQLGKYACLSNNAEMFQLFEKLGNPLIKWVKDLAADDTRSWVKNALTNAYHDDYCIVCSNTTEKNAQTRSELFVSDDNGRYIRVSTYPQNLGKNDYFGVISKLHEEHGIFFTHEFFYRAVYRNMFFTANTFLNDPNQPARHCLDMLSDAYMYAANTDNLHMTHLLAAKGVTTIGFLSEDEVVDTDNDDADDEDVALREKYKTTRFHFAIMPTSQRFMLTVCLYAAFGDLEAHVRHLLFGSGEFASMAYQGLIYEMEKNH